MLYAVYPNHRLDNLLNRCDRINECQTAFRHTRCCVLYAFHGTSDDLRGDQAQIGKRLLVEKWQAQFMVHESLRDMPREVMKQRNQRNKRNVVPDN